MTEGAKNGIRVTAREVAAVLAVIALLGVGWRGKTWFGEQEKKLDLALQQSRTALVMLCSDSEIAAKNQTTCSDLLRPVAESVPVRTAHAAARHRAEAATPGRGR